MRTRARINAINEIAIRNFMASCLYDKSSWLDQDRKIRLMDRNPVDYADMMMLNKEMTEKIDKVLDLAANQVLEPGSASLRCASRGDTTATASRSTI